MFVAARWRGAGAGGAAASRHYVLAVWGGWGESGALRMLPRGYWVSVPWHRRLRMNGRKRQRLVVQTGGLLGRFDWLGQEERRMGLAERGKERKRWPEQ